MVRFSHRTTWPTSLNPLNQALEEQRARGISPLDLTVSNPTRAGLSYPPELLATLGDAGSLDYQPEPLGLASARRALARWYEQRGLALRAERIVLTASSSESYGHLFHLLADPGDEVLIPAPSYPLFAYLADLCGVVLRPYPLRYDGAWYVDLAALTSALSPRTRAVLVVSPNNPTGSFLKDDEARALRELAAARGLALISDEVFVDYPLGPPRGRTLAGDDRCLTFVLGGLSKLAALPQLKLGWMLVSGPDDAVTAALERLEMIADTFLSVATPVQRALPALLEASGAIRAQIQERTARNLAALRRALADAPASVLDVEGGWYAIVRLPATRSEEAWTLALLERGVLVHPGHFFDFEDEPFAVLSLLTPEATFDAGVARLVEELGA